MPWIKHLLPVSRSIWKEDFSQKVVNDFESMDKDFPLTVSNTYNYAIYVYILTSLFFLRNQLPVSSTVRSLGTDSD